MPRPHCLLAWLVFLLAPITGALAQEGELAATVKATYLYKFAPFIEWPSAAAEFPDDIFPICVIGGSPAFADLLQGTAGSHVISGHKVVVRILSDLPSEPACAVLYVMSAAPQERVAILQAVRGKPILTVTDDAGNAWGIINFVIRDNRVGFEIDDATAAADGLRISSKLLSLASAVRTTGQ